MMAGQLDTLYEEVVDITYEYLGPAADRFVTRQIRNHLDKEPSELTKLDLKDLIYWIKAAMSLLTDDQVLINRYISDLEKLTV